MPRVFIIAEAGVNHNGSLKTALLMVDAAVRAGADAVKFQTFRAAALVSKFAPKAAYQRKTTDKDESQLAMIRRLELDLEAHKALMRHCRERKVVFISAPFDLDSIDLLARLKLGIFKVPSGEITNLPYLRKIGALRRKIILSTGMSNLKEIEAALAVLVKSGTRKENITVLHCNTEYPTPFKDVHLRAMAAMREALGVKVGYSDHTPGIEVAIAAAALGACVIEKHFTLDRKMPGPDHQASLEPDELRQMVSAVRHVEAAMGCARKKASPSEKPNIVVARKSIVARVTISKGERFTGENLAVKRPGTGISPMRWDEVLGKIAKKDFREDEVIT